MGEGVAVGTEVTVGWGVEVGEGVGVVVGSGVGVNVGVRVGVDAGVAVGSGSGEAVAVGFGVAEDSGVAVGANVGLTVGSLALTISVGTRAVAVCSVVQAITGVETRNTRSATAHLGVFGIFRWKPTSDLLIVEA